MAIQISGTTVIDNGKRLAEGLVSKYSSINLISVTGNSARNGGLYILTTDGISISLPSFGVTPPVVGNEITFCAGYTGLTAGVTVTPNGNTVMGSIQNIVIDVENAFVVFTYVGGSIGWQVSM